MDGIITGLVLATLGLVYISMLSLMIINTYIKIRKSKNKIKLKLLHGGRVK